MSDIEKELDTVKEKIREIQNLCPNCRNLDDAQAIAGGATGTSSEEGCLLWGTAKKLADAQETIKTKDIIIRQLNKRLGDIGAQC